MAEKQHLIIAALWMEGDPDECTGAVAEDLAVHRGAYVVSFGNDHPQMPELLKDLRRFDLDEIADNRPEGRLTVVPQENLEK